MRNFLSSAGACANREEIQVQAAMESCFGKSVMSGVMGFGMGGLFGMFMASVRFLKSTKRLNHKLIP
jgi:hypothetical protein